MMRSLFKSAATIIVMATVLAVGLAATARAGWLSPFGINSTSTDSQVIHAIERTQEVSLISLGIQGITREERNSEVLGHGIPGTSEKVTLMYTFDAKLGIDGAKVKVKRAGEHGYRISIPDFIFIGYDEPVFEEIDQDGGILRAMTKDIDRVAMVNKVLDDDAQDDYLTSNVDVLEDQARVFYETLIKGVDPDATVSFDFAS
jgi:hypothetical protein